MLIASETANCKLPTVQLPFNNITIQPNMKIFNLIFFLLFVLSAAYNDPDPYIWIPLYGYAAILCWLAFRSKYFPRAYLAGMGVYGVYAIYLFFADNGVWDWLTKHQAANIAASMHAGQPWIEDTREFFGLVIMMVVLGVDLYYAKNKIARTK